MLIMNINVVLTKWRHLQLFRIRKSRPIISLFRAQGWNFMYEIGTSFFFMKYFSSLGCPKGMEVAAVREPREQ